MPPGRGTALLSPSQRSCPGHFLTHIRRQTIFQLHIFTSKINSDFQLILWVLEYALLRRPHLIHGYNHCGTKKPCSTSCIVGWMSFTGSCLTTEIHQYYLVAVWLLNMVLLKNIWAFILPVGSKRASQLPIEQRYLHVVERRDSRRPVVVTGITEVSQYVPSQALMRGAAWLVAHCAVKW